MKQEFSFLCSMLREVEAGDVNTLEFELNLIETVKSNLFGLRTRVPQDITV